MNKIAVITNNNEIVEYEMLERYIEEFSIHLAGRRNTFIIISSNTLGSIVGYLSGIRYGNIPLLLEKNMDYKIVKNYINLYEINYIWVPNVWLDESDNDLLGKYKIVFSKYEYSLLLINFEKAEIHKDLALLLTTSGTTGSNKLVRISYKNILSNTKSIVEYLGIKNDDRAVTSLPMNYTYGLSVINTHLYSGGTILLTDDAPYIKKFWNFVESHRGTFFAGVPYTFELIRKLGIMNENINSLKTITVAGGKIGITEEEYFVEYAMRYDKKFIVMYGQTEATARISYRPWNVAVKKPESIGYAIPGGRMWLVDEKGKVVTEPFIHGEIMYSGENVTMGYAYSKADLAKGDERGGVLKTGDLGYMDNEGYFYVIGRSDKTVKLNGYRIDLENIESMLQKNILTVA